MMDEIFIYLIFTSSFVAETSVLADFDMDIKFKIITCNSKNEIWPTAIGTILILLAHSMGRINSTLQKYILH